MKLLTRGKLVNLFVCCATDDCSNLECFVTFSHLQPSLILDVIIGAYPIGAPYWTPLEELFTLPANIRHGKK
jgi:hypothetical protein